MFERSNPDHTGIPIYRAIGTVMARDVTQLFASAPDSAAIIVIDPDFDGYMAELAKGAADAARDGRRIAILASEGLRAEAQDAGLTASGDELRLFDTTEETAAADWLQA